MTRVLSWNFVLPTNEQNSLSLFLSVLHIYTHRHWHIDPSRCSLSPTSPRGCEIAHGSTPISRQGWDAHTHIYRYAYTSWYRDIHEASTLAFRAFHVGCKAFDLKSQDFHQKEQAVLDSLSPQDFTYLRICICMCMYKIIRRLVCSWIVGSIFCI